MSCDKPLNFVERKDCQGIVMFLHSFRQSFQENWFDIGSLGMNQLLDIRARKARDKRPGKRCLNANLKNEN